MIRKRTAMAGTSPADSGAAPSDDVPAGFAPEDFDLDDIDLDPMLEMQIGLPLRGENFATGEPLVTVDYFGFPPCARAGIVAALQELRHGVVDEGADRPRFLIFERETERGCYMTHDLVCIVTVLDAELRVETARDDVTDTIRETVKTSLGDAVRHLRRRQENPMEAAW